MSIDTLPTVDTDRISALAAELRELLGDAAVSDEDAALERVSVDGSTLSPVIMEKLPLGRAQLVVYPADAEGIAAAIGAAVRHGVPITPRGKGTGNYGQAIPMSGGLVLDMSKARSIVEVKEGSVIVDAGAPMIQIEQAANKTGQQLLMFPSTVQSTAGGFVSGGSGGTGSIKHGMLTSIVGGYVKSLDVVHARPDAHLIHLEGAEAHNYLHNYGTAGIIARVELALEPQQPWSAFYASFDDFHDAFNLIREIAAVEPTPRLVSTDVPTLADALPSDEALPAGKASLRVILDDSTIDEISALVTAAGGTVETIRPGLQNTMKLSMMSYNHPIEWLQKAYPGVYFHIEVGGDALVDRIDEVHEIYPGAMLHLEAMAQGTPGGMLAAPYTGEADLIAGFERMRALGVGYHNPHQWFVDFEPERTAELAKTTDPDGLLNPGKLQEPDVDTGRKR
jgi:FAD/FMN-containing dehydrogenase